VPLSVYLPGVYSNYSSTDVPKAIPDFPAPGITSAINVSDNFDVISAGVQISISHTWAGDIHVTLTSPAGTTVVITEADGEPGTDLTIDSRDLMGFAGESARGIWTIAVTDTASADTGTVTSWSLSIEHPEAGPNYQNWIAGFPTVSLTDPTGDQDGDDIANFLEFLIDGFSPTATDAMPQLETDPGSDDYFVFAVPLRQGISGARLAVQLSSTLQSNDWADAVTQGTDVVVDSSDPAVLRVKLKKSLGSMFVRLMARPE